MKLRSYYYGIVHSSFLLLASCAEPKASFAKEDAQRHYEGLSEKPTDTWDVTGEEDRSQQPSEEDQAGEWVEPLVELPVSAAVEGAASVLKRHRPKSAKRMPAKKCALGEMRFEGACVDKEVVDQVLEERHAEAIRKIESATAPEETAKAQGQLIDTQIVQAEKAEDDLDEILEQLKKEDVQL